MSNGSEACCALGICCPDLVQRHAALAKILVDNGPLAENEAAIAARVVLDQFALAPKSLGPFVDDVVAMAKAHGDPA